MLLQALDGRNQSRAPAALAAPLTLLAFLSGALAAMVGRKPWIVASVALSLAAAFVGLSCWLSWYLSIFEGVNVLGWLLALACGVLTVVFIRRSARWEKGRTATLALHRYLPSDIAQSIVTHPDRLGLQGEMRDLFVLFTDLEGFTRLCQSVEAETVATFLNEYLEALSQVVLAHGGTIDKFVGDALVAFWGAPVAHDDDGERAIRAAIAVLAEAETFRGRDLGGDAPVGRTRIGLHHGSAIVGNFGGEGRLQYTALGDTMNVGARLEGANKTLGTSILLSGEAYAAIGASVPCRYMGRIRVRGRSRPIDIYEPAQAMDGDQTASLNAFSDAAMRGDADALAALRQWSDDHPDDIGIASLLRRIEERDDDGATDIS